MVLLQITLKKSKISFLFFSFYLISTGLLYAKTPEEYDGILLPPYRNVLNQLSTRLEKQITSEMLGAVLTVDPVYRNDSILMHDLRVFQEKYDIPPYDYQFCLAGPMTLNYLIELFIYSGSKAGSYYRQLYKQHDPVKNPGVVNMWGVDIAEFQIMYNLWAAANGRPRVITPDGVDNGSDQLEVDGYYGRFTRAATVNFQAKEELLEQANGIVDEKTWKLLYVRTYLYRDLIVKQVIGWSNAELP